jgi:phage replication O-like protein O
MMANPHIRIDHPIWEALCRANLSGIEYRILLAIIRKTWGWGKKQAEISRTELSKLTGIKHLPDITRATKSLKDKGFINTTANWGKRSTYEVLDHTNWDTSSIVETSIENDTSNEIDTPTSITDDTTTSSKDDTPTSITDDTTTSSKDDTPTSIKTDTHIKQSESNIKTSVKVHAPLPEDATNFGDPETDPVACYRKEINAHPKQPEISAIIKCKKEFGAEIVIEAIKEGARRAYFNWAYIKEKILDDLVKERKEKKPEKRTVSGQSEQYEATMRRQFGDNWQEVIGYVPKAS